MNIVITGGNGFIGNELARYLSKGTSHTIFNNDLSIDEDKKQNHYYGYIQGDLRKKDVADKIIDIADVIFHLAQSNNPHSGMQDLCGDIEQNILPTISLITSLIESTKPVRVIFPSSGGTVYRCRQEEIPFKESDPCYGNSAYGIQKIALENYFAIAQQKNPRVSVCVLRISNPYGILLPVGRKQGFIGVSLHRILNGLPVEIWGNSNTVRDYLHITDLCKAFKKAIAFDSRFDVFNIGSGKGHSLIEILHIIEKTIGRKVSIKNLSNRGDELSIPWNVLNIQKAGQILNWIPEIDLEIGIEGMILENEIR